MKVCLFSLVLVFVGICSADNPPPPSYPSRPPAYAPPHPGPSYAPPHPRPSYSSSPSYAPHPKEQPQPFQYQYGVQDDYTGVNFNKNEEQDAYGNRQGSYQVHLPDGRIQTVKYTATNEEGFQADVSFEGEAQYPPEPKEGYGHKPLPYHQPAPKAYAPPPPRYVPSPHL